MRVDQVVIRVVLRADATIKRLALYPAKRWLTLQHFTGLLLLLFALGLVSNPGTVMTTLADVLHFPAFPVIVGLVFFICAAFLLGQPVTEMAYRVMTLPLFLYFWAVVWYIMSHPGTSWVGALSTLGIWGFLMVARTELPDNYDE